jgi:minor extracellular serine protease Vpr
MKKMFFLIVLLFNFAPPIGTARTWEIPPLPKPFSTTETIMIFSTKETPNEQAIKSSLSKFHNLKLRYTFTEAFKGFSIQGKRADLEQFARSYKEVISLFESNVYKTDFIKSTNNQMIGTEIARGLFDRNGNRLTGKGIKVGVIDTGIDYNHPDLVGNYKGGIDFVDGDHNPMEAQGRKGMTIHGTHVAGIIAANGTMQGVAPDVDLYAYRVLGPAGRGTTDQVLAAIDQTIKDRMDIINLSLGTDVNGPDLPVSMALDKAVAHGIVAVTSNGNSGPNLWTVGSPGTSSSAISVGASTPLMTTPYLQVSTIKSAIHLFTLQGSKEWNIDHSFVIENGGLGRSGELKKVAGKIALIKRGETTFTEKVQNAAKAGAVAVIIYNNTKSEFSGVIDKECTIPAVAITKDVGEILLRESKRQILSASTIYKEEKDLLANFSSRGPVTVNWSIKPDVTAPGVAIKSTIPGGNYIELQGTSMAAPHVTGAVALIKQAHPDWKPQEIKAALMNTAIPLFDEMGRRYKVFEQGAGRIQIEKAIHTKTFVIPSSLSFGILKKDSRYKTREVTIKNVSISTQYYRFNIPKYHPSIRWELPPPFSLHAGEEKAVTIRAILTRPFNRKKDIIEGNLKLETSRQKIEVPYLFAVKEPNYPRIMGFTIVPGDKKGFFRYEAYLPMGAEEFGIALFDGETMTFIGFVDTKHQAGSGLIKNQVELPEINHLKNVTAVAFARNKGEEDYEELSISLKE